MCELSNKERIKLAKVLMDDLNTGDWQELFAMTESEIYLQHNNRFLRDVHWQNKGLKQGCIGAVNHILDADESHISEIWNLSGIQSSLSRKEPDLFRKIESIINDEELKTVSKPELENTNESVYEALKDAEVLIHERGAPNAYDRMHTALHSFLRQVCENNSIKYDKNDAITALLPEINNYLKSLPNDGRNDKVFAMLRSANSMLDSMNYLRNHNSLSHPNERLLNNSDARFAINLARSIMSYIDNLLD